MKDHTIILKGDLTLYHVGDWYQDIEQQIKTSDETQIIVDGSQITALDSAGVVFLNILPQMARNFNKTLTLTNVPARFQDVISYFTIDTIPPEPAISQVSFFERIGEKTYQTYRGFIQLLVLITDVLWWSAVALFDRSGMRKGSVVEQSILLGSQALGIVALILFLIGFVMALQSAAQLRQFGATIYVANLMAIGICRELGPLMTAIIVSGRSGSAIAAEVATMKYTEELDALKTMALNPIRFVVVPKFLAMTLCLPLLTIMADFFGMSGGFLVGVTFLDISPNAFFTQSIDSLLFKDIITGLIKSISFAWVITITGVFRGLNFQGGAEGVGIATTSAVVTSIFMIIVVDSFWGIVFYLE